ncbi:uncharacterized protein LOC134825016 [Bolinopsis microptera]|uniref:uncharacterized protein LOC134825016 n=1 Tax=Bolinopsis microptera TaxID=2820187 RepID=UPI003079F09D
MLLFLSLTLACFSASVSVDCDINYERQDIENSLDYVCTHLTNKKTSFTDEDILKQLALLETEAESNNVEVEEEEEEEESETPPWVTTVETATATVLLTTTGFETYSDETETYSTPFITDETETYSTPFITDVTDTATTSDMFTYEESTSPVTAPFNSTTDDYWTIGLSTSPPKGLLNQVDVGCQLATVTVDGNNIWLRCEGGTAVVKLSTENNGIPSVECCPLTN